ncbi:ankyrin repeat domain-containing protein SOWAHB-like [Heptranchias perlo]|uniref:ankyrin repeat domain-containing protein SOWAHB-like n=1 Tax=Heptranchias perlo TaxID=212740 RepID=UPI00355ACC0D
MAETFSQEAVLDFLLLHRGKVRNVDLTSHFRRFLKDPERQVQTREQFKKFVNSLAVVKEEGGVKYILLRKRYKELIPEEFSISSDVVLGHPNKGEEKARQRAGKCKEPSAGRQVTGSQSKLGAEERRQESTRVLKVNRTHRRSRGEAKAAHEDFSELSVDGVQAPKGSPKASPTILQGGNCADEANRGTLLQERYHSSLDSVREDGKRANVDHPVRQGDCIGVINRGEGSVICKSTAQRSRNPKNEESPVTASFCPNDTVSLFNGDSNRSRNSSQSVLSRSTTSPILSHVFPSRSVSSVAKCKGKEIRAHESPPNCNAEIISDQPVIESIQYKPDQNPSENFVEESKKVVQRVQRRGITAPTHENKMISHCKNTSSPKKHGTNNKVLKMLPGLLTGSNAEVLVSSAICTEECIQNNQRKLSLYCRPSAGSGKLMNSWHSEGQSISPKRHKPLKKMVKSNRPPHKMPVVPHVSNQSTTPKIVVRDASLHVRDRPPHLAQTESHSECRKEDPLKIGGASEKSSLVPLDSTEHEWIMKTTVGMFEQAYALFHKNPNIVMKRDFISGYTVLHWIAKHGNHHALSQFIGHARKRKVELNVDIKSTCGYTPLHIAAIHGQLKIIQYLVKKYRANVNLRDHSGKKPWQYLNSEAPRNVCQMLGAAEHKPNSNAAMHSQNSSTFPAKDIARQESSHAISRKTSFAAFFKSPRLLQKSTHLASDRLHAIIEEDEE